MRLEAAIESLRGGGFILLHDSEGRENEVDMVVAAEFAAPEHIVRMRRDAGGMLCMALGYDFAQNLGLRYMHEMLGEVLDSDSKKMIMGRAPYGDHPTFSIAVNHAMTYTGITDSDRALTIQSMAKLHSAADPRAEFERSFKTPGHVQLLIAKDGLLRQRRGHTEMSVYLAKLAGLVPAAAICEMMDSSTHSALSPEKAQEYASHSGIPLLYSRDLLEYAKVH